MYQVGGTGVAGTGVAGTEFRSGIELEALPIELRIYLSTINPEFRIYENPELWANWVVNPPLKEDLKAELGIYVNPHLRIYEPSQENR